MQRKLTPTLRKGQAPCKPDAEDHPCPGGEVLTQSSNPLGYKSSYRNQKPNPFMSRQNGPGTRTQVGWPRVGPARVGQDPSGPEPEARWILDK